MSSPTAPSPPEDASSTGLDKPAETTTSPAPQDTLARIVDEVTHEHGTEGEELAEQAGFKRYGEIVRNQAAGEEDDAATVRAGSPVGSVSTHGDSPSIQGSLNSFASGSPDSRLSPSLHKQSPSFRPFERRFQSRLKPSLSYSSDAPSSGTSTPQFLHSRNASSSSRVGDAFGLLEEEPPAPWEVIRWTKLKKVTQSAFSEAARRKFGFPTCIAVSSTIALGTSKGIILIFDFSQNLKAVIGPGTKAIECGAITAIAVSQDHSTIAGGHLDGSVFTYELAKPNRPFLSIPPVSSEKLQERKQDGHVEGTSVIHLGFLGTRHTALVSADERGMAFSHLATRGFGAAGRTVKTTRLLGRYPFDIATSGKPRKPSSVFGFAVLPLGNVPQATDTMGLVAMLTPYLLVVVSTTPIAQTHFKASRSKEVSASVPVSGALAWFPAIKSKPSAGKPEGEALNALLAYSWSNVLTILELVVEEDEGRPEEKNRPPVLSFRTKARWKCDEAIVGIQWLSRQIIAVLTSTQRLFILEGLELRATESFDLMTKHIMHHPTFAPVLSSMVGSAEDAGTRPVADAFYNSFRIYKGKIFLLCSFDISIGALSNWADRLLAMMEVGDYIGAIKLATAYYTGGVEKLTIGLPDDPILRHPMVEEKLIELIDASLRYVFGKLPQTQDEQATERLRELVNVCFPACLQLNRPEYLLDEVYDSFEEAGREGIVLEALEQYILSGEITSIPPTVTKALVAHYTSNDWEEKLEEMLCLLDTATMDVDQLTSLCKEHKLYDALIYIWNRALGEYITPFIHLLNLLTPLLHNDEIDSANATKIFPYLAYIFTGRIYPKGIPLDTQEAESAKSSLYYFLFVGRAITWPMYSSQPFTTTGNLKDEPSFPYLRLLLQFDASSFLSVLNEAFEDPFLNGPPNDIPPSPRPEASEDQVFGRSVNRQYILSILLEVLNPTDFAAYDTIYLDMFIARNLPKFPQHLLLSGSTLHKSLVRLCSFPDEEMAEDCQLSVEYLLSVYKPPDVEDMIELFTRAKFYRVLRSVLRAEKKYARLLEIFFEDEEAQSAVFDCIRDCLRKSSGLNEKQRREVRAVLQKNAARLVDIDLAKTVVVIEEVADDLHKVILDSIADQPRAQYSYLKDLLEPASMKGDIPKRTESMRNSSFIELYVRLMCRFDPKRVPDFVETLKSGDIRLEAVLPSIEENGIVDAAVRLIARAGKASEAMERLAKHFSNLEATLTTLLEESKEHPEAVEEGIKGTLEALQKYVQVGLWLCHSQTPKTSLRTPTTLHTLQSTKFPLTPPETLWLTLLESTVHTTKPSLALLDTLSPTPLHTHASTTLRTLIQSVFHPLITTPQLSPSFLPILREFLSRASRYAPTLSSLRAVLQSIFSTYTFESSLLGLAQSLLDQSLFFHINNLTSLRARGWRPGSQTCEACKERVWGPGVGGEVYEAWEQERRKEEVSRALKAAEENGSENGKGKGRAREEAVEEVVERGDRAIVVFVCRHVYHRRCVEKLLEGAEGEGLRCVSCGE